MCRGGEWKRFLKLNRSMERRITLLAFCGKWHILFSSWHQILKFCDKSFELVNISSGCQVDCQVWLASYMIWNFHFWVSVFLTPILCCIKSANMLSVFYPCSCFSVLCISSIRNCEVFNTVHHGPKLNVINEV